jgi:putative restriction endonuclease
VDGIDLRDLIDAAHIHGWSDAPAERLDPANGIALCALHHRAFDSGLMHFAKGGRIVIADPVRVSVNPSTVENLIRYHEQALRPWQKFPTFLHR